MHSFIKNYLDLIRFFKVTDVVETLNIVGTNRPFYQPGGTLLIFLPHGEQSVFIFLSLMV